MRFRALLIAGSFTVAALVWLCFGLDTRRETPPASADPDAVGTTAADAAKESSPQTKAARVTLDLDQQGDLAPARRVSIEAVFADDDRPAAGAEVRYWPPRTDARRASDMRLWRQTDDLEVALQQSGRVAIADHRGIASIEAENGAEVAVRCGDCYAEADLAFDPAPQRLPLRVRLHRDVTLHVLVTDPQQRPLPGILLIAYAQLASRVFGTDRERAVELGCSNAKGLLTMPHLQQRLPLPAVEVVDWSMQLGVDAMHLWDTRLTVTVGELAAAAPIHLVLPTGGTVEVCVVDADGSIVPAQSGPALIDAESHAAYTPTSREYDPWQYAQVPLGRTLQLQQEQRVVATFVGPRQVGEVVRQRLQLEQRCWRLRGRVRRADGIDLAFAHMRFELVAVTAKDVIERVDEANTLGSQGRFDSTFFLSATVRAARVHLQVDGAIALDRELAPGTTDLGDLLLQPPAWEVLLATVRPRCGGQDIASGTHIEVFAANRRDISPLPVHVQRDGDCIRVRGGAGARPLRLRCSHPDCLPIEVAFAPGVELSLELQRAAKLWLSIEPPPVPRSMLRVTLCPRGGDDAKELSGSEAGWGRWSFDHLPPGEYRLRIVAGKRVLCEVPELAVRAGDNFWPADGSRLDLRGSARAIHIGARHAGGRAIEGAEFLVIRTGATALDPDWSDRVVGDWILLPEQPIDVLVRAPGYVPVRVVQPLRDVVMTLSRSVTVRLVPPDGDPCEVDVEVVHDGLSDALLRRFDESNQHAAMDYTTSAEPHEINVTPGTELRVRMRRGEVAGAWQSFVVAEHGPQDLLLR